uniref:PHD domain-containing protein n=1 Tax=Caenorhabditis tropicalis TaxID=1561998 RepID=A0A1I7UZK6_9PELO
MSDRTFGSEIGNRKTTTKMTASNSSSDDSLVKPLGDEEQMDHQEKSIENGNVCVRLPKPLAVEVYTKIHNSTLSKEDLLDEIEDLVDEKYFIGETLLSGGGKEHVVSSSERKGGLTLYTMEDGTKIGHRDLRRKKGLSVEDIKQIAIEDVELIDGKVWKVKDALLKECPIRETKKFAPIFSSAIRRASGAQVSTPDTVTIDDDDEEGEKEGGSEQTNGHSTTPVLSRRSTAPPRASGGPAATCSRRLLDKKKEKEAKEKERLEKKEKEKEEKARKKEEERQKKQAEKDEKAARKEAKAQGGSMDRFVKKQNQENGENGEMAPLFSTSKWAEKRTATGVKKLDDAWKKRDLEAFNDACTWCEKNLSANQRNSIENPLYRFAIQKCVDKTKDRAAMKMMKPAKKAEFKAEQAQKRKELYSQFEPRIRAWFSEDVSLDDLLLTTEHLRLPIDFQLENCDEEMLRCMELSQFFVSMRKILLWNENIKGEQLKKDLHEGLDGFRRSTYKMIANLLETALQEKEHEKAAHCNARLSEFPITEHTITELVRAFFVGNTEMSYKRDSKKGGEDQKEDDEGEPEEPEEEKEEEEKEEEKEDPEKDPDEDEEPNDEEEAQRIRMEALFRQNTHIYEWEPMDQLEVLSALKEVVHGLPIIREWFQKDANTEQLTGLRAKAAKITQKMDQIEQQLLEMAPIEITDDMTRNQTREAERIARRRAQLEENVQDLKEELEENRQAAARERDDLERIFRVVSIGTDRHLRKYYWFAYSADAGIWVQDFGTTSYEKWVQDCYDKGFLDVETPDVENRPEYEDLPLTSAQSTETWYKLDSEAAIRQLIGDLKKNGKREKPLKKYLLNNLDDILASIEKERPVEKKEKVPENSKDVEMEEPEESEDPQKTNRFQGPYGSLQQTMMELLIDWQASGITKIVDTQGFETKLRQANGMEEMKSLVIELTTSIPESCLIEKFPQQVAIAKKCFSHLKIHRFRNRVNEATNPSCLHMLLAYFDARIDQQKTLTEMPCQVCRRKQGTRKLMCKQCAAVYHIQCHRPTISRELYEEEGFKEGWWCAKCTKEDRRRQLIEAKEQREKEKEEQGSATNTDDDDEEEAAAEPEDAVIVDEEEETMSRGRSAKRKANEAMRNVLEFEGVLRHTPAPPPPKRAKKAVLPEVQDMFSSIEKANPRLYKFLQLIPSSTRSTRASHHETRSLPEIEEDLDVYTSPDQLHAHLTQFFQQARGYVETHNPRKLDELESMISKLNFV